MASVIPTLIIPNVEYALFIFSLQRETKLNSQSNSIPKSLILSTISSSVDAR